MGFQCLVEQAGSSGPFEEMLQLIDAKRKCNARKAAAGFQLSAVRSQLKLATTAGVIPHWRLEGVHCQISHVSPLNKLRADG